MQTGGYMSGFGNESATEAVEGALPIGRNSPQRPAFGLYAEQFSGTAFTAPRGENRRSWLYRIRPSAGHRRFVPYDRATGFRSGPFERAGSTPNRLRWDAFPIATGTDWIDGVFTLCGNGDSSRGTGSAAHVYTADRSMERAFFNADGEMMFVPQQGSHRFVTEFGRIDAAPGTIVVIPRGVRFRLEIDEPVRGYVCENYGAFLRLPELGPIGANALANARDFETPVAAYEDAGDPIECVQKYDGRLWTTTLDYSPFDVVAWHGNHAPYRYDLARFCPVGATSFDHPDPSIYTVLTSPSELAGIANVDFVIFPPRWMVAENTFRPPWFHRNVMSEFMGLIYGSYDSKEGGGFVPGGSSLHNTMQAHGPDHEAHAKASEAVLEPRKLDGSIAFMFESRWLYRPTAEALAAPALQDDYDECWAGFAPAQLPGAAA